MWVVVVVGLACGGRTPKAPPGAGEGGPPDPPAPPVEAPPAEAPPVEEDAPEPDPKALYAACRDRVEGPEQDGECSSDADCAAAGCSGEVCTTVAAGSGLMTPCEIRPCFSVLEDCACRQGTCTWSVAGGAD